MRVPGIRPISPGLRRRGRKSEDPVPEKKGAPKPRGSRPVGRLVLHLKMLGPGLVTGASDDDPSGIGTYSQTGALFGFLQLWTALFTFPLMVAVQEICARVALHTGNSLTELIRKYYPKPLLYFCVFLLYSANTINLGADLGAMAAACQLLFGHGFLPWLLVVTSAVSLLQLALDYRKYAQILRLLTLSLLAYVLLGFVTPMDWHEALRATLIPSIRFDQEYLMNLVAILGTTVSPYLFFWQTNQEVDEMIAAGKVTPASRREVTRTELKWMRTDVVSGMFLSNVIMWFIVATAASAFYEHRVYRIESAEQAARALAPIAGRFAYLVFAAGIVGTGLLAVPILAGSAAYAVAEAFKLRKGFFRRVREAPGFYAIIVAATLTGSLMNLLNIDPIKALYYAAVLNGLAAPPLLVIIMLISNNRAIMRDKANSRLSRVLGWGATAAMTLAALGLFLSMGAGGG